MSSNNNKDFVWNDDLVLEFARFTNTEAPTFQGRYADLDQFKQSKTEPKQQPLQEQIEVTLAKGFIPNKHEFWTAHLYSTVSITEDKFPAIKQAIEKALNEDTVVGKPDWDKFICDAGLASSPFNVDDIQFKGYRVKEFLDLLYEQKTDTVVEDKPIYDEFNAPPLYTQTQVDAIREEAFGSGYFKGWCNGCFDEDKTMSKKITKNAYQDYLQSLTEYPKVNFFVRAGKGETFTAPASLANHPMCKKDEPETKPTPPISKEWEILTLRNKQFQSLASYDKAEQGTYSKPLKDIYKTREYFVSCFLNWKEWEIYSVRRLSDNVVFSVGDVVVHKNNVINKNGVIESFRILNHGNTKSLFVKTNNYDVPLCYINLSSPKPTNEKTVTDNTDVPCLSLNDVMEALPMLFPAYETENKLKQLVSQKLKQ